VEAKSKKQNNAAEQSVGRAAAELRQLCPATKMQLAEKRWRRARYKSVAVAVAAAASASAPI